MKSLRSRTVDLNGGIYLRSLTPDDVSQEYADWLNDPETARYLESRFMSHTLESCAAFVKQAYESEHDALLGIFQDDKHVGNIKIGNIHPLYRRADVGLVIGKAHWGRGIGRTAIGLAEEIAFNRLKLHKLYAGAYKDNVGSIRAFLSNGWNLSGELKEHFMVDGRFIDSVWLEKLNKRVTLRPVEDSDIHTLFELANDPAARENSFNRNKITWQEHERWFNAKKSDANCFMYIAQDRGGSILGQMRIDKNSDIAVMSLNVAASYRGQGYGTDIFRRIVELYERGTFAVRYVVGRVIESNAASRKALLNAGFIETPHPEYMEYWYPNPPEGDANAKA